MLRNRVAPTPPAWRPAANHELVFGTVDGQIALAQTDTGVTSWRAPLGEPAKQLVWSEDGQRLLALGERSLRIFDAEGNELGALGLPLGPSGVAFLRKSHRFVLIRWQPATGRSELVLMDAEAERGEERSLFSAAGEFGPLAVSPNGRWLLVGWVGRRPVALPETRLSCAFAPCRTSPSSSGAATGSAAIGTLPVEC